MDSSQFQFFPPKLPSQKPLSSKLWKYLILFGLAFLLAWGLSFLFNRQELLLPTGILAGGETTVNNRTSLGYSQPAPNLSPSQLDLHTEGDRAFEATFVTRPADINPGLGPVFNNASCVACHTGDGRGMPVEGQLLVRVSLPANAPVNQQQPVSAGGKNTRQQTIFASHPEASVSLGNAPPVPGLGTQIQDHAVYGYAPEANVKIDWQESQGKYGDGTQYSLRSPNISIALPDGEPLPQNVLTSPRIPPSVFGKGLLEAIPDQTILALADAEDRDRNGISGRPNLVWDGEKKKLVLGRFGHKANTANLLQQAAAAYVNDMGVTNPLFPEANGSTDIDPATLKAATFYTQTLAVPARTLADNPEVKRGHKLFIQANCNGCHIQELKTGNHEIKALANQTIYPYTDMLLHDLGTGLADGRPDFAATGNEWRTAPLWGLGLTQTVLPYSGYLHDGRARTIEEAILWHSGEADPAKEKFRQMQSGERQALVKFLNSL
ncbi:di-heme oxidoredictase family protein [Merismopedia glauca]|uniref:Thiol oxidoreductase n=2 Tax=Merismopedia TaxID=53402 RepID=A0A2T1BXM4_9CYAN|nr:thiol oxidoreductase [Merismopedia glauca CCAP 1448/3]